MITKLIIFALIISPLHNLHAVEWIITNASDALIGIMLRDKTPRQPLRLLRLQPTQSGFLPTDKCRAMLHIYVIEKEGTLSPVHKMKLDCKHTEFSLFPKDPKNIKGVWKIKPQKNAPKPVVTKNVDTLP